MGLTGRYNFPGIQKAVRAAITVLAASTTWGAWLIASPFQPVIAALEDLAINWLVNRGLIIIDVGAVMIEGKINQEKLDSALDAAFTRLQVGRDKISPEEGAKIDAETTQAFDQFADVNASGVSNVPDPSI